MGVGVFLFALDCFPLFQHGAGVACFARAEDMRVPPDQFVRHMLNHLLDAEPAGFARDLRVHYYEQQKIAELLAKMRVVLSARGLSRFVYLLYERRQQRLVGLLAIPGATIGSAKFRDNVAELREVLGDLRSEERRV